MRARRKRTKGGAAPTRESDNEATHDSSSNKGEAPFLAEASDAGAERFT